MHVALVNPSSPNYLSAWLATRCLGLICLFAKSLGSPDEGEMCYSQDFTSVQPLCPSGQNKRLWCWSPGQIEAGTEETRCYATSADTGEFRNSIGLGKKGLCGV